MSNIPIRYAECLTPLFVKHKRIKIAVGGRSSSKSTCFSDAFISFCAGGERLLAAREFMNSIEDSVHELMRARIGELPMESQKLFDWNTKSIFSQNGGRIIYRGLAKNPLSIQSMQGIKRVWIEEGQAVSEQTLDTLLPTIREPGSEIWISMNRKSVNSPISVRFFGRDVEHALAREGFFEDETRLIVQCNYWDNPWFPAEMEVQRKMDKKTLSDAKYDHIWNGGYDDEVENSIIEPDWFDACVDAHVEMGWVAEGIEVVAHDPADTRDPKALAYRHGSVILDCQESMKGNVNDGCTWATNYAISVKCDLFIWDGGGLGAALRKQVNDALGDKQMDIAMFLGQAEVENPDHIYVPITGEKGIDKPRTNKNMFLNRRAQKYIQLRDRCFKTYEARVHGRYYSPDEMISFSKNIKHMDVLRAEMCKIPRKDHAGGKFQIMSKPDMMKLFKIPSPNMSDSVMMSLDISKANKGLNLDALRGHRIQPGSWMA